MKSLLKAGLETVLDWGTPSAVTRRWIEDRALILAYHNVVPDEMEGVGDSSLHIPRFRFAQHLDAVRALCDVVSLSAVFQGRRSHQRPVVAITFDDAYLGAVSIGAEELTRRSLPATFFVPPGRLGGQTFWWDEFKEKDGTPLRSTTREFLLRELGGTESEIRLWAKSHLLQSDPPAVLGTSHTEQIKTLAGMDGMDVGAHSWSHPNLAAIDPARLQDELDRPLSWLREHTTRHVSFLAFPYGAFSPDVLARLEPAGYLAGLGIEGGWVHGKSGPFMPRLNIPSGLTAGGLRLRVRGLFGRYAEP